MVFNKVDLVRRFGGDDSIIPIIIPAYIEDTERLLLELAEAVSTGDCEQVAKISHSIKGASCNIAAEEVAEVAFALELAGKSQKGDAIKELLNNLINSFIKLKDVLHLEN